MKKSKHTAKLRCTCGVPLTYMEAQCTQSTACFWWYEEGLQVCNPGLVPFVYLTGQKYTCGPASSEDPGIERGWYCLVLEKVSNWDHLGLT